MSKTFAGAVLLTGAVMFGIAHAQQQQTSSPAPQAEPLRIFIGQPLRDAAAVLAKRQIEFGEGLGAVANADPDLSSLNFYLDKDHTYVSAYFSRSRQTIIGLSMVFFPSRAAHDRLSESQISATELTLHPDTSYSVHFAIPRTLEQIKEAEANRPQSVYPPAIPGGPAERR